MAAPLPMSDASTDPGQQIVAKAQASQLKESLTPELDPTVDLTPFERAAKDQFANNPVKQDKTAVYFGPDYVHKTNEQIVLDQYSQKIKAVDAATEMAQQEMAQAKHSQIIGHIEGAGIGSDVMAGRNPEQGTQDVPASGQLSGTGTPASSPQVPNPGVSGVTSPEYTRTSNRLESEYGNEPAMPGPSELQRPNKNQMILGLILALSNPGAIPHIASAMFSTADEQRQFQDKLRAAQYAAKVHGHDAVVKALEQHLRTIEQRDMAVYRGQVSTENNVRTTTTSAGNAAGVQAGQNTRLGMTLDVKKELHGIDDKTRRYIAGLKDPVEKAKVVKALWPEATDAQVREMALSDEFSQVAKTEDTKAHTVGLKLDNTLKAKTLRFNIQKAEQVVKKLKAETHYTVTRDRYTQELTRILPMTEALKVAALMAMMDYHQQLIDLGQQRVDVADEKAFKSAFESGYDDAQQNVDSVDAILETGVDENGDPLTPETKAQYEGRKKLYTAVRDAAGKKMAVVVPAAKGSKGGNVGGIFRGKGRSPRLGGFVPNAKDKAMGNVPLNVEEPTPESVGEGILKKLGGSVNDYAQALA